MEEAYRVEAALENGSFRAYGAGKFGIGVDA